MSAICNAGSSEGNCRRRSSSSSSSSSSERSEDNDRRGQGVAITIATLSSILDDKSRTLEFLRSFGVLADKYMCATCGKPMCSAKVPQKRSRDGIMWRCRKDGVWRSIRKGTWLENSKCSIKVIVLMTYCFCKRKSVLSASRIAGLSGRSVLDWFLSCREICSALIKKRGKIGGPGVVVEMDDSHLRSVKYEIGKLVADVWVWGAVVCGNERGQLVLHVHEKRDLTTLQCLIEEYIEDGSVICSDKWDSYDDEDLDLQTFATVHNYQFRNKAIGAMEQHWKEIKTVVGRGKRRLGRLQSHLDEYVWREGVIEEGCVFHSFMRGVAALYVPCVEDPVPEAQENTLVEQPRPVVKRCKPVIERLKPVAKRHKSPPAMKEEPWLPQEGPSSPVSSAGRPNGRPARHRKPLKHQDFLYPASDWELYYPLLDE